MPAVELGLALPQYDFSVPGEAAIRWETTVEWARTAEQLGFGSVWLADHLFLSVEKYGGPPGHHWGAEPITALGALAALTGRVRLGTLVLCAGFRPATVAGNALASLDVISGGRLDVGVGAGWFEPEYAAAGIPFERPAARLRHLAETIETWRAMWTGADGAAPCLPPPAQEPHPPVWVGGKGDRLLELVARHADGWNTVWTWTLDDYRERVATLEAACERVGRDPSTVRRSVGLYTLVGEDERDLQRRFRRLRDANPAGVVPADLDSWREGHLVGTVAQVSEQLAGWAAAGVTTMVVGLGALPFAVTSLDDLELVAVAARGVGV